MNDFSFSREQKAVSWTAIHRVEAKAITQEVDIFDYAKKLITSNPRWDSIAEHAEKRALLIYRQNGGEDDDILIIHEIAKACHLFGIVPKAETPAAKKEKKPRGKRAASKSDADKSEEDKK